jgi:hypothetical protein
MTKRYRERRTETERRLLGKLPLILLLGTLLPLSWTAATHWWAVQPLDDDSAKALLATDFYAIALVAVVWMWVATVAVGCVTVLIMKGPRRQADSYPLPDEHPGRKPRGDASGDADWRDPSRIYAGNGQRATPALVEPGIARRWSGSEPSRARRRSP